ncbi:MAG: hypothetical protein ACTSVZ_10870, partial [Promethearchaeota archaeon]
MEIRTRHYKMEFPKFARKIKTKIHPLSSEDRQQIASVLTQANIKFEQEGDEQTMGIYGNYSELSTKLSVILQDKNSLGSEFYQIAKRLRKDVHFRAIIG